MKRTSRAGALRAAATAALAAVFGAHAADPAPQVITITTQKRAEDIRQVPLSVSVVGGDAMQDAHVVDFGDLSRTVPNLSFSTQAGPGLSTLQMRGVSSQAGSATVSIYLDDVSLTTRNLYSQGTAEPRFFDIDRVEVVRGPQGTLYGASSLGGRSSSSASSPTPRASKAARSPRSPPRAAAAPTTTCRACSTCRWRRKRSRCGWA